MVSVLVKYGDYEVSIDLGSIVVRSCSSYEVCGEVRSADGFIDRRVCTIIEDSSAMKVALREKERSVAESYCYGADNFEQCIEYYEDSIREEACEALEAEDIIPYLELEEIAEKLVYEAEAIKPRKKR